ncbi:MAG: M15 family metallopeptidase [Pseudomonadota bacterium]
MFKVLKPGSTGPVVTQWQTFLRGQGFVVDATGLFDEHTEQATRAFQKEHRLAVDGVVGNQSFGKAAMLGFELVDFTEVESAFPPKPGFAPLVSNAARQQRFGPLEFVAAPTPDNREALRITNQWDKHNVVMVPVPQVALVKGGPASGRIAFHKKAAQQLQGLWAAWEARGLLDRVLSWEGAYNPRFVRGGADSGTLSNHAFATAFDINAQWNRLGAEPATAGSKGCLYELVPVAHEFGFYWGGHFNRRDGMHFELALLQP